MAVETLIEARQEYVDISTLITCTAGVQGGQPCVAGTRMRVRTLVNRWQAGLSPDEVAARYDGIEASWVYAAVAFYQVNQAALDKDWADEDAAIARLEAEHPRAAALADLSR